MEGSQRRVPSGLQNTSQKNGEEGRLDSRKRAMLSIESSVFAVQVSQKKAPTSVWPTTDEMRAREPKRYDLYRQIIEVEVSGGLSTVPRALKACFPVDELRSAFMMRVISRDIGEKELSLDNVTDMEICGYFTPLAAGADPTTKQLDAVLRKLAWILMKRTMLERPRCTVLNVALLIY